MATNTTQPVGIIHRDIAMLARKCSHMDCNLLAHYALREEHASCVDERPACSVHFDDVKRVVADLVIGKF